MYRELVLELVKIDLEQRWRSRQCPSNADGTEDESSGDRQALFVEGYLEYLSQVDLGESSLLDLMAHEYRVRLRWGDRPNIDEFASRFGKLSNRNVPRLVDALTIESSIQALLSDSINLPADPEPEPAGCSINSSPEPLRRVLERIRPFSELSPLVREAIAAQATERDFVQGEILLRQGEAADCLLITLDGVVEVSVVDKNAVHTIARLERNTVVGEIGLFAHELRSANVTALTSGRAAIIPKEKFEQVAGSHPHLAIALSELIAERLGTLTIDALCGKVVNRYQIRQRLGRGGMGIVYAAVDSESGRRLALKMLRHDLVFDRLAMQRFHQEAEIVKTLLHPNIVRVFDEFSAFGTFFIAMELCEGMSLSAVIQRMQGLPAATVRGIVGQLAASLSCAHASAVAHRDLKPSNVMVGHDGIVKLTDFGLARQAVGDCSSITTAGQIIGTPRYMAPEQLAGERGDEKSDVFALGAVTYELLTGQPMFKATRFRELLRERRFWRLPQPTALPAAVDAGLYELLRKALAEEPDDRDVSLQELSEWAAPLNWQGLEVAPPGFESFVANSSTLEHAAD